MDKQIFWEVIGNYNRQTWKIQIALFIFVILAIIYSYTQKEKWVAKFSLGITNIFIAIGFYAWHGIEPIQRYFALPLYLFVGILFLYESCHSKNDILKKPNTLQILLLLLYLLYPFISMILGNSFPKIATYIMPCPVVSLSIAVYAGYKRKNKILLALLTIWGLTGIKSFIFHAYEDMILLVCGLYGIILLINEIKQSKKE